MVEIETLRGHCQRWCEGGRKEMCQGKPRSRKDNESLVYALQGGGRPHVGPSIIPTDKRKLKKVKVSDQIIDGFSSS